MNPIIGNNEIDGGIEYIMNCIKFVKKTQDEKSVFTDLE